MFGYSWIKYEVFTFPKRQTQGMEPKIEVDTKLLQLSEVTAKQWRQLQELQGRFAVLYLKWRYGSSDTHILLAFTKAELAHVEWIVPARKIQARYPFVTKNSYSIVSCLTAQHFRGLGVFPAQLGKVIDSAIPSGEYWIWTASDNLSSTKGIRKAEGVKVGEFVQRKWLWGCVSHIEYFHERGDWE